MPREPLPDQRERVSVERLRIGDEVEAVSRGPRGKVIDADRRGWTLVQYARAVMPYKRGVDRLSLVSAAHDEVDCSDCGGVGEVLTEDGLHGSMLTCQECEGTGSITEAMIDRGVVALLAERPLARPDHAAPILQARREVKAVLRAALDETLLSPERDADA